MISLVRLSTVDSFREIWLHAGRDGRTVTECGVVLPSAGQI